jgi:Selenocysteine lyase
MTGSGRRGAGIGRRALLGSGLAAGAVTAGAAVAGCTAQDGAARGQATPAAPPFNPADWESVRAQFPLDTRYAQFAAFVLAAHPAPVRRAIEAHRDALDRDTDAYLHGPDREQEARHAAAEYLGARNADEIVLTDSTTMSLGLLYSGLRLAPGQDVLTTEHDFYSTHEGLRMLAARTGAKVRRVRLYEDPARASADEIVDRLRRALRPRTRVVAVTWVHSSTGVRLPIRAIADMLAEANRDRDERDRALLCVDGVHGFGAVDAGVDDLGCDFLATGTHKWLFGPRGTGLLWGRDWSVLDPLIPPFAQPAFSAWIGGGEPPKGPGGQLLTPGGYHTFEHRWALREAFEFHARIGRARVAARIAEQATRLKQGLAELPGARLITPLDPELSAGIVCVVLPGVNPTTAVERLRQRHRVIASVTPYRERYVRFGPSMVTTPEQVDQVVRAVAALT